MSVSLLNTAYLWGFFSLLIPLVIHLFSKRKQKVIKVASIRFFDHEPSPKAHSIRLSDKRLLLLRMLLLSIIVLMLAEPLIHFQKEKEGGSIFLFDQRLIESIPPIAALADSIPNREIVDIELNWADYLKIHDFQTYDTLHIFTYNQDRLIGLLPHSYSFHIEWQLVDMPTPTILNAWQLADSLFLFHRSGKIQAVHMDDVANHSSEFSLEDGFLQAPNQLAIKLKNVPEINLISELKTDPEWWARAINSLSNMRGLHWSKGEEYVEGQLNMLLTDQENTGNKNADFIIQLNENSNQLKPVQFRFEQLVPLLSVDRVKLIREVQMAVLPELIWEYLQPFVLTVEEGHLTAEKAQFEAYYQLDSNWAHRYYEATQTLLLYLIILLMVVFFTERWWAHKSKR